MNSNSYYKLFLTKYFHFFAFLIAIANTIDLVDQKRNFRKHSTDYLANNGFPYDLMSAMHYRTHAFSKNKKPTIIPRRPVPYLRCRGDGCPSAMDVQKINFLYKCHKGKSRFRSSSGKHRNNFYGYNEVHDGLIGKDSDLFNNDNESDYGGEEDDQLVRSWHELDRQLNRPNQSPPNWWQSDDHNGLDIW